MVGASSGCTSAKEILLRRTDQVEARARGELISKSLDDSNGDSKRLAHHELGGCGELVRNRKYGSLEGPAIEVYLASVVDERGKAGDAERDIRQPLAPRPAEGIGDDHRDLPPEPALKRFPQALGRVVGVLRKQDDSSLRGVRGVDAAVGADESLPRLDDQDAAIHP